MENEENEFLKPFVITNEEEFNNVMARISELQKKGHDNINESEMEELRIYIEAAQAYEETKKGYRG